VNSDWLLLGDTSINGVETGFVSKVIDGDTIELTDGRKIRYLNIDTPETVKPNTPVQCFGREAKILNEQLVKNHQVWLTQDKDPTDRFGRDLRFVFTSDTETSDVTRSVNAYMVQEGYATTSFYSPNTTYKYEFELLENQAQLFGKGLWSEC
jgi:micrococcal nuclease